MDNIKLDCDSGIESVGQIIISIIDVESERHMMKERDNKGESSSQKNYLMYTDTITYFDEDTYKETVRVIDVYDTKEVHEAYQEALKNERRILIIDENGKSQNDPWLLYQPLLEVLKNDFGWLEKNKTCTYKIFENGKVIKEAPFMPSEL